LQQRGDKLEELVAARTAELAEANAHLQAEIEERIQAQASLQASNERLQAALAELSAAQEQVLQQERLMAVGQLAAGIAHDFNNILTPIMGYADLLLRQAQKTDGRSERQMAIILEQSQQARRLVRQLLDFSRQSVHHPQAIEFKSFLADSLKLLTHMLPETIQIRLDGVPGEYWLTGDPAQLQQVITNLALNAQDAMPAGGSLTFKLSSSATKPGKEPPPPEAEQGAWLLLTVTDDGCGMPADVVPHIFEPFFTTKDVGRGSGLGLAQVYGIVQQHGGDINVQSSPDQGTCFTIYLPQLRDKALLPPEA
jgi:signal transduction histidine kinase